MPSGEFLRALRAREASSSTVIGHGLAVPHVVVSAERTFDILLARCRPGITFPGHEAPVHTVFVLAGSQEERNFHLRAVAAIAQVAQDSRFDAKWIAARNEQALRDLVLLGDRRRGSPARDGQPPEPTSDTTRPADS
jgi:mannitol/fructose-specific phosphotransferase system IIA component (Ntr-type)